jgi:hypothetical protein
MTFGTFDIIYSYNIPNKPARIMRKMMVFLRNIMGFQDLNRL